MGLGTAAVQLQNVPEMADESVMQSILGPMISRMAEISDEPTAFLCRSSGIAQHLHQVAQSCDAWDPRRMTMVFDNTFGCSGDTLPYQCTESDMSLKEAILRRWADAVRNHGPRFTTARFGQTSGRDRPW